MNIRFVIVCMVAAFAAVRLFAAIDERVPVTVTCRDAADLAALVKSGADIEGIAGLRARAFVRSNEIAALRGLGIAIDIDVDTVRRIRELRLIGAKAAGYHSYVDMTNELAFYVRTYSNLCRLASIGKSVQNRDLWMIKISDNPDSAEDEPGVRYISTIHGTEWSGMENCLRFIDCLLTNYNRDTRLTRLVDECEIWIMPIMNPDGYEMVRYENANWVNLNRNFPDRATDSNNTVVSRQPETAAVMQFGFSNTMTVSANFHEGEIIVNYPYDGNNGGTPDSGVYVPCPDDRLCVAMARTYADANPRMFQNNGGAFTNGICNGAQWYTVYGGMQDWNYVWQRCLDMTIELNVQKMPPASQLPALWAENMTSMIAYAEWALRGIRGVVTDDFSGQPISAMVTVSNTGRAIFADPACGDYHRMLVPGTYALTFTASNYYPEVVTGIIVTNGPATRMDVGMTAVPEPASAASVIGYWLFVWGIRLSAPIRRKRR